MPPQIDPALEHIQSLLSSYRTAKVYTEGINVVITGKPNVGKSSLLNTLTGKKKAIVTGYPGYNTRFNHGYHQHQRHSCKSDGYCRD